FITTILLFLNGWQLPTEAQSKCNRTQTERAPTVQILRKRYDLFKKFQGSPTRPKNPTGDTNNRTCPWTYVLDTDQNRLPQKIPTAICSQCSFDCTAREYWHMALKKKCDKKTGEFVWVKTQ
ncbi:uncharacterized protein LOC113669535, partial [Paramuricea clavata]